MNENNLRRKTRVSYCNIKAGQQGAALTLLTHILCLIFVRLNSFSLWPNPTLLPSNGPESFQQIQPLTTNANAAFGTE